MPPDAIEPGSPNDWMRHALSDLELSKKNDSPVILREELCFHAQQAAEKAIKAVLIACNIHFPKTHNITILCELVPHEHHNKQLFESLSILTDYAVTARYPGNIEEITDDEYGEAIELAAKAVEWARSVLAD